MKTLLFLPMLLIISLTSCGGGGGKSAQAKPVEVPPAVIEVAKAALNIVIPQAIADQVPQGAYYLVKVTQQGGSLVRTINIPTGLTTATFKDLDFGTYNIEVTAENNFVVLAKGSSTVVLGKSQSSVQVPMTYLKGSLVVEPILESQAPTQASLGGKYDAVVRSRGCIKNEFTDAFGTTDATVTIEVSPAGLALVLELFPKNSIIIDATLGEGEKFVSGTGTFQSSDFTKGTAEIDKIVQLEELSIFMSIKLIGDCETTLDVTGFRASK